MRVVESFPRKVREIVNTFIPMSDGVKLAARIWLPEDAEKNPRAGDPGISALSQAGRRRHGSAMR